MNILRADKLHGIWRKTGDLQKTGCQETNALIAKWASEETQKKIDWDNFNVTR